MPETKEAEKEGNAEGEPDQTKDEQLDAGNTDLKEDALAPVLKLMEEAKFQEARQLLSEMLKDRPKDSILLHNMGVAYTEENRFLEAEESFTAAFEAQRENKRINYATMFGLATVLTEQGDMGKLLQAEALYHDFLEKAISEEEKGIPETYRGFCGLADNLERQKRWAEAAEAWRHTLKLATPMFGDSHERTKDHEHRLARAERLSRWQRNIRFGIWAVTLSVPAGLAWQWSRVEGPTAIGDAWNLLTGVLGFSGVNASISSGFTAEL
eukprot:TRINITY_DN72929_c0_g1_i1.p1 TRINITY_DN72929_c0_g1~~TRINITY_DN72929_c0_g1_i1.p1  ORF type:complete len:268 (+),score=76.68 TRINITY_DN72929_c0_g1_i1:65-868(+)